MQRRGAATPYKEYSDEAPDVFATMSTHAGRLEGKHALITGGSSGIGLATAHRFAIEGAHVYITGRRQEALDAATARIGSGRVTSIQGDVSQTEDIDRVFDVIRSNTDQLHVVFANAGSGILSPLGSITEDQFDTTFNTNVKGVVFTVQAALPLLRAGASVILNASTTSVKGTSAFSIYSASKAAVRNLARSWILDLKGRDIRVNVISPGVVPTPGYDGLGLSPEQIQGFIDYQVETIPAGRVGTPDEIASAVTFLASDDSSFVNGIELFVDGGMTQV
jgi:NAD(P)-dependent dehydrogenase (short-subunit alcohol dehydrogenase family)